MKQNVLYTVGYEGRDIPGFIRLLNDACIKRVVDIREAPISHKRGFSKNVLASHLAYAGIEYAHLRMLGAPRPLRRKLRGDNNREAFLSEYRKHLSGQKASLHQLHEWVQSFPVCLMCFEHSPEVCHRSAVAHAVEVENQNGLKIQHL